MTLHEQPLTAKQLLLQPDKAARFNQGKVQFSYLFDAPLAMEGLCRRFELGARKYSRDNWKKGLPEDELIDALLRHLKCIKKGEYYDEDGGTHPDAVSWNAVVLAEQLHKQYKALEGVVNASQGMEHGP